MAMRFGMVEREAKRGQRLASARRHGQREQARRLCGARPHMVEDMSAQAIEFGVASAFRRHIGVELGKEMRQAILKQRPVAVGFEAFERLVEIFSVLVIRIHQTRKEHPGHDGKLKRRALFVGLSDIPDKGRDEAFRVGDQFLLPDIVQRFEFFFQPTVEAGGVDRVTVRQSGMMASDAICDHFSDGFVVPAHEIAEHKGRAGSRMIYRRTSVI
ncbi:MAG: hypothetical protein BGP07_12975 [Rhizobiales bacterium 63-22]|nr:MAG: hypothetical protein BGP07_12975 [Rhizobiales bacterium 63-22]